MNSDTITSYIRTGVGIAVGAALSWLAAHFGIVIDDNSKATVSLVFGSIVIAIYYAVVRLLESRWPQLGWLLGVAKAPAYTPPPTTAKRVAKKAVKK